MEYDVRECSYNVRCQISGLFQDLPMSPQAVTGDKDDEGANRDLAPQEKGEAIQMSECGVQLDDEWFHLDGKDRQAFALTPTPAFDLARNELP